MPTRVYYKHTRVKDTNVPYHFQCENCMKNSGDLQAHIIGAEAVYNSNFKTINDDRANKLEKEAYENLAKKVKETYKDATEKEIYSTEFKDECPHCHKPQSWGVSGLKKKRFDTPIVIFILGIIFFVIALIAYYFTDIEYLTLPIVFGILGVAVVCSIIVFIWNTLKIKKKIKETSANGTQNTPVIDWNTVQELLSEKN